MEPTELDTNVFLPSASKAAKNSNISISPLPTIDKESDYYDMNRKQRGFAIILNHEFFDDDKNKPRTGTNKDTDMLKITLKKLGFDVKIHKDLERKEIKRTLQEFAGMDHTDNDCIVVVVLTHGSPGFLEAKDGSYREKEIWEQFLSCKSLIGKPKLFFIQACRGEIRDKGSEVKSIIRGDELDGPGVESEFRYFSIPTTADLLMMHSTYPGYAAFRSASGTCFIQALCKELDGTSNNLLELLTSVCKRVAYDFQSFSTNEQLNGFKQMPCIISTLTKKLIFTQKNINQTEVNRIL